MICIFSPWRFAVIDSLSLLLQSTAAQGSASGQYQQAIYAQVRESPHKP